MNLKNNRKGILYSISAMLLLVSLFSLASIYYQVTQIHEDDIISSNVFSKLRYLEDDIVSKVYRDLLPYKVSYITRSGGKVQVNFNDVIKLRDGRDFDDRMSSYESYIESTYASHNKMQITLDQFTSNITIDPYGSVVDLNENTLEVYNDPNNLTDITVKLKFNYQNPGLDSSSTTAGSINVRIIVINEDDDVKSDTTTAVDPTVLNNFTYKAGTTLLGNVHFGKFGKFPSGTLQLNPVKYTENSQILLEFNEHPRNTVLKGGTIKLVSLLNNYTKTTDIIMIEE
jgi:hypothetical protein